MCGGRGGCVCVDVCGCVSIMTDASENANLRYHCVYICTLNVFNYLLILFYFIYLFFTRINHDIDVTFIAACMLFNLQCLIPLVERAVLCQTINHQSIKSVSVGGGGGVVAAELTALQAQPKTRN